MIHVSRESGVLLGILLLALAIRAGIFFHGIRGSDAYAYALHAHDLATGHYRVQEVGEAFYGYRYGLLLPLAAAYALLGVGDVASAAIPMGVALATVAITYSLGANLAGRRLGRIAALIMATYPASIIGASLVSPDSFLPFYVGIGVWLLLPNPRDARGWMCLPGPLAAGAFLGLAVLTRQTSVFLTPLFLLLAARPPHGLRRALAVLLGISIPGILVGGYYLITTGDPFFEFHQVIQTLKDYDQRNPVSLWYYTRALFGFERYGLAWHGLTPLVALIGTITAWRPHRTGVSWSLTWLVPMLLVFEFGNRSPLPLHKNINYLSVVAIPLVLLAAFAVHVLLVSPSTLGRRLGVILMTVLALTGPYGAWRFRAVIENDAAPYLAVHRVLQQHPETTVYLPRIRWPLFLSYFVRYDRREMARWRDLGTITDPAEIRNALVVIHDRYSQADIEGKPWPAGTMPAFLTRPPEAWRIVARHVGTPAYNTVTVYEAPGESLGGAR